MVNIWFSSDLHLSHYNIIAYGQRPFSNIREMDEALLTYHNELVKPSDHWYNLGDVTMRRGGRTEKEWFMNTVRRFNGHKRLLLGNHDHFPIATYIAAGFEKIYATWRGINNILLSHIPVHPGSIGGAIANVHGHIHQNPSPHPVMWVGKDGKIRTKPYINICVEVTDYRPIHLDELLVRIAKAKGEDDGEEVARPKEETNPEGQDG
jgi:calcineurin-like phosphoesterase family protein